MFALLALASALAAPPVDVAIRTSEGTIVVRLDAAHAPRTVKNFLRYVDAKRYDGTTFYRTVDTKRERSSIDVIQGGLQEPTPQKAFAPIALEPPARTGLHNTAGTIAMARTADPNSAASEFFINLGDDRFLDALGGGYAVFGTVVRGLDVAQRINVAPAQGESLDPAVKIITVRRVR